ncbi:putative ribonuclease H-like domain-containing protein [Tanacetum coccineum]
MDLETAQIATTAKLPILKQGPVTTKEKVQKKNDMKERSMLLMTLPNEHLMTFNKYKDAKTLFAAIQIRFGGNKATKKTRNTLLKQMYENFSAPSTESLDSIFNRLQKIKTGRKITINGSDTARYDKSKVECFNCHKMGHFARECRGPRNQDSRNRNQDSSRRTVNMEETSSKAMVAIDGAGFDWSYMADDEVPTNIALMAFLDSDVHNDITCSKTCLKSLETLKTQIDDLRIEFNKFEFNLATYKRGLASVEEQLVFYKKNKVILYGQLVVLKTYISYKDSEISMLKNTSNEVKGISLMPHLIKEFGVRSQSLRGNQRNWNNQKSQQPGSDFVMYNKACFVCGSFDHVQADYNYHQRESVVSGNNFTRVNYNYSAKKAHPIAHRNMVPREVLMKTGLRSLNIDRPAITSHPKTTVYSAIPMLHFSKSAQSTVNAVKASACWVWRPTKLNSASITLKRQMLMHEADPRSSINRRSSYVDSGCSRHITGNMSYLSGFKEFDGGYLVDESQVLLKVPRKNNMYSVDMKNIVPKKSLTCLVAKATLDESMLWHSRLGHVNFKTINKLVKENLVRGLPLKCFENDQTYVACLKRKQHKASFKIVIEASIRRRLQLADYDGISSLPTTKIFEQLSLMGPKKTYWEQFISNIATAIICLATNRKFNFSKLIFDADEAASTCVDVRYGGATTTATGLEAGQGSELMVFFTTLSNKVESLETDLKHIKLPYGATYTKLIKKVKKLENKVKTNQARKRARIIVSDDEDDLEDPSKQGKKIAKINQDPAISLVQHDVEIQGRHEHAMEFDFDLDAAKDVSTAEKDVSTAKPVSIAGATVTTASVAVVSTASPTRRVSTADDITIAETLVYIRRSAAKDKGKGKMDESEPVQTKTKLQQEQERLGYEATVRLQAKLEEEERQKISRKHEATSSFNVEEWEDIQAGVKADEELAQRYFAAQRAKEKRNKLPTQAQQRTYMSNYIKHMRSHTLQQLIGYSFDKIKTMFETTMRRVNTFVLIESEVDRAVPELAAGSSKGDTEEELDQESSKRQKIGESSEPAEEPKDKEEELSQEELQQMMIIVPEQGMNVEVLQTKFNSTEATNDKERELWVELKRVHHVSTEKGIGIYMLVEKDYPLSRGTLTLILVAKLLVEQDNEISRELLRKIFMQAERPRR